MDPSTDPQNMMSPFRYDTYTIQSNFVGNMATNLKFQCLIIINSSSFTRGQAA